MDGSIFRHLAATVYATAMGFFIGAVGGAILGVWLGVSPFASRLLNPYLNALNALPKVALAPLFVLWFGLGIESKIALAAVLVLFLVFLNTFAGVREVDQDLIDGARLMRATRTQVITQGHHPVGDVVGVRRAQDRDALRADRRGARRDDRRQSRARLSGAVFRLAVRFRRRVRGPVRDRAARGGAEFLVEIVQGRMERWRIVSR